MAEPRDPLDCRAAMRRLWEYLDDELSSETLAAVRRHLAYCAECRKHVRFERDFLHALESMQAEARAPAEVHGRVHGRLRSAGWSPSGRGE